MSRKIMKQNISTTEQCLITFQNQQYLNKIILVPADWHNMQDCIHSLFNLTLSELWSLCGQLAQHMTMTF